MMTAKAKALGMSQTIYRNASGLPDDQQITTARDQAVLGRAIQDRFPRYYQYFATRTFEYRGKSIRNHNHLLGVVDGLDGIKTGYIHDSGFNIVTSVRRANRHVVAVVFGGRTADARDARARSLIDNNINIASVKRTAPPVVEGEETAIARIDKKEGKEDDRTGSAPVRVAATAQPPAPPVGETPPPGSTDPIKPVTVKTLSVHPGTMYAASLAPLPTYNRQLAPAGANAGSITTIATVRSEPQPSPVATASPAPPAPAPAATLAPVAEPPPAPPPPQAAKVASAGSSMPVPSASAAPAKPRSGWLIQIGALPDENEAKQRLETAQTKAKSLLRKADPFTERTEKGDKVLYRARFAGLEKDQAEAACKYLKRSAIPCMLLKTDGQNQ